MAHVSRRTFLSQVAASGAVAGSMSLDGLAERESRNAAVFTPNAQDSDARVFAAARRELLFPPNIAFCNTGTFGASPREVIDAVVQGYRTAEHDLPDFAYRPTDADVPPITGYRPLPTLRAEPAALINAPLDDIAFTQNATMGMSFLANGLDLERGDEIVTTDQEHPGGISPWLLQARRRGVVVKQLALGPALAQGPDGVLQLFADGITSRTRVVMFSHITSTLGIKLPARELCALARDRGVIAIVDGAQPVGQIRVDVQAIGCDAYVTSTHKWLCAPKGTGLLYIRREAQDRFWTTLATTGFDEREVGAFRFMRFGTGSLPTVLGLRAAVRFMTRLGIERIERWDAMLTERLRQGLARIPHVKVSSPADPRFSSAMTTFAVTGRTSDAVQDELWTKKIRVRAEGEAGVRLSAHFYVAPDDIDRALNVVESMR
jgi:isopenicillin-N epimerase